MLLLPNASDDPMLRPSAESSHGFEGCVGEHFSRAARRHAERPAICSDRFCWAYAELDARSTALARSCRDDADRPGGDAAPIAILAQHDAPLIAAIVAAVKLGRPYVVLDPAESFERQAAVLKASGATRIWFDGVYSDRIEQFRDLPGQPVQAVAFCIDAMMAMPVTSGEHAESDLPPIPPAAPISLTFTSGTTGQPKGVCQLHRGVLGHWRNYTSRVHITWEDRLSLLTPCSLAASLSSLWGALLNGAAVLPCDVRKHGVNALPGWARRHRPTIVHCVPSLFSTLATLIEQGDERGSFDGVRILRLGGEAVTPQHAARFCRFMSPACRLMVSYGSTETGMVASMLLDHGQAISGVVPVGTIAPGMHVELVDDAGGPVAPGEVGQIVVRGSCLALGYWRDAEATARRFTPDPADPDSRIFATGDLGRFDAHGLLEHRGRVDAMLKIRGRRVEPAEVEAAIMAVKGVRDVAVLGQTDGVGETELVACVAGDRDRLTEPSLRAALSAMLSSHLIPSRFLMLDSLPRQTGGKIDRAALAAMVSERRAALAVMTSKDRAGSAVAGDNSEAGRFVAERAAMIGQLTAIFSDVLARSVDPRADFFRELGMTSLQAAIVLARLAQALGRHVPVAALLQNPNVESLARYLVDAVVALGRSPVTLVQAGQPGTAPLFFLHGDIYGAGIYCQKLARGLGDAQPLYSLAPLGYESGSPTSIAAMAEAFAAHIRAIQRRGPYRLGGFCNGGLIAYEIAAKLRQAGERIDLLAVVRAAALPPPWPGLRRCIDVAGKTLGLSADRRLDIFAGVLDRMKKWTRAADAGLGAQARFLNDLLGQVPGALGIRGRNSSTATVGGGRAVDSAIERMRAVWLMHRRAMLRYRPQRSDATLHLFWPQEDQHLLRGDRTAGWGQYARQVTPHLVPGGHTTCVTHHTGALAAALRVHL